MKPLKVSLLVGRGVAVPAPAHLTAAFRSAEITQNDQCPSGFQITFQATRGPTDLDYSLFGLPLLQPFNRLVLTVTVDGVPYVLMDGLITRQDFTPANGKNPDTVTVTGEDVSVAMALSQVAVGWPAMPDFLVVDAILAEYLMYGLIPVTIPTPVSMSNAPDEVTLQQMATDREFIQQLASRNGYIFQVYPGPVPGTNTAYWGPPVRVGLPNRTLNVNTLLQRNVDGMTFSYDGMAPTVVMGMVQDAEELDELVPILADVSLRLPPMASEPAIVVNFPYVRKQLFADGQMDPIEAYTYAQGIVDRSTDRVVTATGELDVLRYGSPLLCPGLVGLRGAGYAHDGLYYVESVTHKISREGFHQAFRLAREGLGSTLPAVLP